MSRTKPIVETPSFAGSSAETATFSAVGTASAETLTDSKLLPVVKPDTVADPQSSACYRCQSAVPSPIPPLAEPAELSNGRWGAGGAKVEVCDGRFGRRVTMEIPGVAGTLVVEPLRMWPGTKLILAYASMVLVAVVQLSMWPANTFVLATLAVVLGFSALGIFAWLRWLQPPLPDADDVAVDIAWREVLPRLMDTEAIAAACRCSVGRGIPADRAKPLRILVEKVADGVPHGNTSLQLLAVSRTLQALDAIALGTDKTGGLSGVFEPFFEGELGAAYAEAAAEMILHPGILPDGERLRLRILLFAAAFDSGFLPDDLSRMLRPYRHLRSLMAPHDPVHLNELYAVWRGLPPDAGEESGRASTIFELAIRSPGVARKLLNRWPDILVRITLPDCLRKGIGDVVLTPRGLFLDDLLIEENDASVEVERSPTGSGWYIAVGCQKVSVDRKPPGKITQVISAWLDYRRTKLLAAVRKPCGTSVVKLREFLEAAVADCPQCGARNLVMIGETGEAIEAGNDS